MSIGKIPFDWEKSLIIERAFWLQEKKRVCSQEWLDLMRQRTRWFLEWYQQAGEIGPDTRILHVGPGPDGEINFIGTGRRYAVDPLADFYKQHFADIMDHSIDFRSGRAEKLPFDNGFFDLVIAYNSLDHTEDPSGAFDEVSRVLKAGGVFYLGLHIRSEYARLLHELKKIRHTINDHYYCFTQRTLRHEISLHSMSVFDERGETELERLSPSRPAWRHNRFRRFLGALRGHDEETYHLLSRRN